MGYLRKVLLSAIRPGQLWDSIGHDDDDSAATNSADW